MCGIVGLFLKNPALRPSLGRHLSHMLVEMTDRGPDSAGIAVYHKPVHGKESKLTLFHAEPHFHWREIGGALGEALKAEVDIEPKANHVVMTVSAPDATVRGWLKAHHPEIRIMGYGQVMEVYKDMGLPKQVADRYGLARMEGTHAIGHTRMATESAVTTAGSHPFATGADLCLVHNGSLSNHTRLRDNLKREGLEFQTENDTEVAAAYMTWKLRQGRSLRQALEDGIKDLDGFYTFCIGTHDGFAVVRDPIACKHAVLAETDDWVAMATEYRAISHLPGSDDARIWEPEPQTIYTWEGHA
jgi:amidophosphoribosyltransferase